MIIVGIAETQHVCQGKLDLITEDQLIRKKIEGQRQLIALKVNLLKAGWEHEFATNLPSD